MIHRAASVLKEVKWWSVCTDWQICCLELRLVQLVASEPGKHPFCSPSILCPTYISQLLFHTAAIAACNCTPPPRCTKHPPRCTPPPRRTQASSQVHPSILQVAPKHPPRCTEASSNPHKCAQTTGCLGSPRILRFQILFTFSEYSVMLKCDLNLCSRRSRISN